MKGKIVLIILVLFLTCCNQPVKKEKISVYEIEEETKYGNLHKVCLNDVYYWYGYHTLAVAYNYNGTIQTCVTQ